MIKNVEPISSKDFNKGLVTRSDFLKGDIEASPNTMDVQWRFDASLHKRMGCSSTNSLMIGSTPTVGWIIDSGGNLSTNLNVYWKLEEASGKRFDQYGSVNLDDFNGVTNIVGIRGNAALFTQVNSQMLVFQDTGPVQSSTNFSIAGWIYLNSTSTFINRSVVSKINILPDTATLVLMHLDTAGGLSDFSARRHVFTANGNAAISATQSVFGGYSLTVPGAGDYLNSVDSDDWYLGAGTGDFTIDLRVRFTATGAQNFCGQTQDGNNYWGFVHDGTNVSFKSAIASVIVANLTQAWAYATATWYHLALIRSSNNFIFVVDGTTLGAFLVNTANTPSISGDFNIARDGGGTGIGTGLSGFIDEFRLSNIARWSGNFSVPLSAYNGSEYEYSVFIDSTNNLNFVVSSSGTAWDVTVKANSIGALNTGTFYNYVVWHSNNSHVGISVNLSMNTSAYTSGVRVGAGAFGMGGMSGGPIGFFDGRIDETGIWSKVLTAQERIDLYGGGTGNTFTGQGGSSGYGWGMFDFGVSSIRWLTVAAGTGIYASSNKGTTFVTISSSRTQMWQNFERSKNVLIATSDAYDVPLYWAGSAGVFASTLAPNSAPLAKFSINYQGFLILLNFMNSNGILRKRGFAYADENLQLTDTWQNSFDLPSSADDEITGAFRLYKFLYVSTRYKLFRLAFVGGNPDWSFLEVKNWGFTPRTPQVVSLKGGGQVAVGMDWDRRLRIFDGFDDTFISDNIENDNNICDFALSKVSYAGSGLAMCFGVLDPIEQEYRLNVAIGSQSTQTTHAILLNARNLAFYPYQNQQWQAMCVAESNNQRALMAVDRSGFIWILNSGNLDGRTAINENYDSPPLFYKLPEIVSKGKQLNLYFGVESAGRVYYRERFNLSNQWSKVKSISNQDGVSIMTGTENVIKLERTIDVPSTYNTYQFQITSSSGTANPWQLDRLDYLQQGFLIGKG